MSNAALEAGTKDKKPSHPANADANPVIWTNIGASCGCQRLRAIRAC